MSKNLGESTMQNQYQMGMVGNCNFSALIDQQASVQWLCWPRFDSSFIFGSLLDQEKGGKFTIEPCGENPRSRQKYLPNTNILSTIFEAADGSYEVIDFAPRFFMQDRIHKPLMLFRKIRRISGTPRVRVCCKPVGEYGQATPEVHFGSNHIRYHGLGEPLRLTTNASLNFIHQERPFALTEDMYFVLSWGIPLEGPLIWTFEDFLTRTQKYWTTWVERCTLPRIFQKEVIRSALALKIHQYEDTGGIVASCTTSLPEIDGEGRNWDYRFCWLRDTYYTLSALESLGHFEEMEKYSSFIENLNIGHLKNLQPVYRIDGLPEMPERELPLAGFRGNQPVRIGNGAVTQIQNDGYGQILLAIFNLYMDVRHADKSRISRTTLRSLLKYIETTLESPDNGVWEFRGRQAVHSYTLLFHWAGAAAARKIALSIEDEDLSSRASAAMKKAGELLEKCYDPKRGAYTQAIGSRDLDASLLQMITLGYFHDKPMEKAVSHLRAIQKELEIEPGFLVRYRHDDDFGKQKSAFLVCSFWLIESLIQTGFLDEAEGLMRQVLRAQNHLGLMSEDFDTQTGEQWGNFPQTYSHVGLINCAFALDRARKVPHFL